MSTSQLTIQLPASEVIFLEDFAKRSKLTVSELIDQYVKQLRTAEKYVFHPEIEKYAGVIPNDVNVQKTYVQHIEKKHQ